MRKNGFTEREIEFGHLADAVRVINGVRHVPEYRGHLFVRLEVKLAVRETHPVFIFKEFSRLDAQQNLMRERVALFKVVAVVGGDEGEIVPARDFDEDFIDFLLLFLCLLLT